jgi:DNA-binding response OmpR family regulator
MAQDTIATGAAAPPADEVRVVVVDDHLDAADMMAAALELEGYQAQVATSGEQALALIETFRPHVVLLDVNMPGMDGRELTRRLRAQYVDEMVLIAVSGSDPHDERVSETFDAVDHYFRKPIDLAALRRLLRP